MIDTFRTGKAYTVTQAARLAGTSPQNVARWLRGYAGTGHKGVPGVEPPSGGGWGTARVPQFGMAPVFGGRPASVPRTVSFLMLTELVVVARFRRADPQGRRPVSLETLRRAHDYARRVFGLAYPFASLNLKVEGGHVLHDFDLAHPGAEQIALDLSGQWLLPLPVRKELEHFDFDPDDHLAERWFPLGREGRIVVDPHIAGGRPVIAGTGVTVDVLRKRFLANESIAAIAEDFEIGPVDVEQALKYAAA